MPTAQTWQTLCPGEKNRWFDLEPLACGGYRVLPHLYQFGANSFLLVSDRGAGMVVDPNPGRYPPTTLPAAGNPSGPDLYGHRRGFADSAQAVLAIASDLVCNGHRCIYRFAPSHYRRILRWSRQAESAVRGLCPSSIWQADYDPRATHWEPFVSHLPAGSSVDLALVHHNYHASDQLLRATPVGPEGWYFQSSCRRLRVPSGKSRWLTFSVQTPSHTPSGRYLIAADLEVDGRPQGELGVALVDIR